MLLGNGDAHFQSKKDNAENTELGKTKNTEPDRSFDRYLGAVRENSRIDSDNNGGHQSLEEIMQALNAHDANVKQYQRPLQHRSSEEPARIESNKQAADPREPTVLQLRGGGSELSQLAKAKKLRKWLKKIYNESPEDRNKKLIEFYKILKCDKNDKTYDFIEYYETEILRRVSKQGTYELKVTTQSNRATSTVFPEQKEISVSYIRVPKYDRVQASDMIALHYLFSMQQFYGIGESDDKPIPSLESDRSTTLEWLHAHALKVRLSPLFSSSPSKGSIDQIPEQLRKMKKLTFKGVKNPETTKVMDPYCPLEKKKSSSQQGNDDPSSQQNVNPNQNSDSTEPVGASDPSQGIHYQVKKIFPRGSRAYNDFFMRTPLGKCVARIRKKYFIDSNISRIEYHRQDNPSTLGKIIIHFDYEE